MRGWLLDTNVLSEFSRRDGPDERVAAWLRRTPRAAEFISVITIAEIERGIQLLDDGRRRASLEDWLAREIEEWFSGRILPITRPLASKWAMLQARHSRLGRTLPTLDSLIAATALEHDLTLATRNVRDFEGLGVDLLNPWDA